MLCCYVALPRWDWVGELALMGIFGAPGIVSRIDGDGVIVGIVVFWHCVILNQL